MNNVEVYLTYPMADLADRCWADILAQAKNQDLFEPISVVMPNRNLQRWFQMYIAKKGHTATQIKFLYVETAIKELFGSLVQNQSIEAFSRATLRSEILFLLYSDFHSKESKWPHLLGKIESNDNQKLHTQLEAEKTATMTRLFQVANQLARHFEDYQYHRASSLEEWKLASSNVTDLFHDSRFHNDLNSEEYPLYLEQQSLYQTLYSKLKQSGGTDQISLSELIQQLNTSADMTPSKPRSPLFLFGLSLLSRYHISCFQLLSDYFPIKFYLPDLAPLCFNQPTDQKRNDWNYIRPSRSEENHPVL
ncbi:MAG: exodeoxyribonuclease V subunit gamma, partial [Leptonema sp. (in: Bacteria)]|nr:exodeoxyribonuclease V subunit gamma [Leptonema sp. (in: bacteria)]